MPAPTRAPPPGPDPAALARYGELLSQRLASAQDYPRIAAMRGWEGEVTLLLTITRTDGLKSVTVRKSSGHEVLDRHAIALVEACSPLPTPPPGLGDQPFQVTVPVRYRLRPG